MPLASERGQSPPNKPLLDIAEALGQIAEGYDRILAALVEVSRQNGGDEAAERARQAIARGRELGARELKRIVSRELQGLSL